MVAEFPARPIAENPRITTLASGRVDRHLVVWPGLMVESLTMEGDAGTLEARRIGGFGETGVFETPHAPLASLAISAVDEGGARLQHVFAPDPLARTGAKILFQLGFSILPSACGLHLQPQIDLLAAESGENPQAAFLSLGLEIERPGQPVARRALGALLPLVPAAVIQLNAVLDRAESLWRGRHGPNADLPDTEADRALADPEVGLTFLTAAGRASLRGALLAERHAVGAELQAIRLSQGPAAAARAEAIWQEAAPALVAARLTADEVATSGLLGEALRGEQGSGIPLAPLVLAAGDRIRVSGLGAGVMVTLRLPDNRLARADRTALSVAGDALDWAGENGVKLSAPRRERPAGKQGSAPLSAPLGEKAPRILRPALVAAGLTLPETPAFEADLALLDRVAPAPRWLAGALAAGVPSALRSAEFWIGAPMPELAGRKLLALRLEETLTEAAAILGTGEDQIAALANLAETLGADALRALAQAQGFPPVEDSAQASAATLLIAAAAVQEAAALLDALRRGDTIGARRIAQALIPPAVTQQRRGA